MKRLLIIIITITFLFSNIGTVSVTAESGRLLPISVMQKDGEKWGYIDYKGNIVIMPQYDFVKDYNDKRIAIVANGKASYETCTVRFIDTSGRTVSGPFQALIPEYNNGIAILRDSENKSKVFDENGTLLFETSDYLFDYEEGLIRFSHRGSDGKDLYGYMDLSGKPVIQAKYQYANAFHNGWASVSITEGENTIIDKRGDIIQTAENSFNIVESRGEGLYGYQDSVSKKYGYKTDDGKVAISPKFDTVYAFQDGFARVAVNKTEYEPQYGLIDKEGRYVISPIYSEIVNIGEGLYSVSNNTYSYISMYSPKAIFNNEGKRLTDFKYYTINKFDGKYSSVCDETSTFLIDTSGNPADNMPIFKGIGTLSVVDGIIKAQIDGNLEYMKLTGESIWKKDENKPFDNNLFIKKMRYRFDFCTYVEYPEILGLANKALQEKLNTKLKDLFTSGFKSSKSEGSYTEDITIGYNANVNKNLLVLEKTGYSYFIGAAHGMPIREYYYIDLSSGAFYKLSDLFITNSKYTTKLASIIRNQIALNLKTNKFIDSFYYFNTKPSVDVNQGFIIGGDSIKIYYQPYELTAYAYGFAEFEIPYGQLTDIINTKGGLWKSFNKTIIGNKVKVIGDVGDAVITAIKNQMKAYENSIITAVNTNNFSKVEGTLFKGSSLYESQKQLVQSLYNRKINEKLVKYDIYAVTYNEKASEYLAFVTETVAVKYPGKSFVNKSFSWCYSLKYDKEKNLKLCKIAQW